VDNFWIDFSTNSVKNRLDLETIRNNFFIRKKITVDLVRVIFKWITIIFKAGLTSLMKINQKDLKVNKAENNISNDFWLNANVTL
jgi:hypothetical protein